MNCKTILCSLLLATAYPLSAEPSVAVQLSNDFTAAAKKAIPAVVSIKVELDSLSDNEGRLEDFFQDDFFRHFFGQPRTRPERGPRIAQGSGFIISAEGSILTNNHVVKDAKKIKVQLNDGRELEAKVIGQDSSSDIALIKIEGDSFPSLQLGDSDALEVGQWVIAIGNPLGLQATLTVGVVSAKSRANLDLLRIEDFIQTDAAINQGNSGGPLLNLSGDVIGMNTALASSNGGFIGLGFAIPSNILKVIVDQLQTNGSFTRGFLGVLLQPVDQDLATAFGLKKPEGGLVADVSKDSPAEKAGLKPGDIITKLNGKAIENVNQLRKQIALVAPGTEITLLILRGNEEKSIQLAIGAFPEDGEASAGQVTTKIGLSVEKLTPEIASSLDYSGKTGVIVSSVSPNSPAALAGIKKGALIISVNQTSVNTPDEFIKLVKESEARGTLLLVKQGAITRYILLKG